MKSSCPTCHSVFITREDVPDYNKTECPYCHMGLREHRKADGDWPHHSTNLSIIYRGSLKASARFMACAGAVAAFSLSQFRNAVRLDT